MDLMQELDAMVAAEQATKAKPKARGGAGKGAEKASPATGGSKPHTPSILVTPEACDLHALARVAYIGEHQCPECNRTTRFVAAQAIRYATKTATITRSGQWDLYPNLPLKIERLEHQMVVCPSCLCEEAAVDEWVGGRQMQYPLWGEV